jgi:catechol 2,3-dioxygenase-like lactoylglutathione lyase family enzyme
MADHRRQGRRSQHEVVPVPARPGPGPPRHDDFTSIEDDDGTVLLCLHEWGGHGETPPLRSPGDGQPGNGALLFMRVDDFDASLERARALGCRFETDPEVFESGPGTNAFTVRDPDGYYVTINAI